jgi:hypothetical protein
MNTDDYFGIDQVIPADSKVEIIELAAEPYQDLRRVKVHFRLTYFQQPPNASLVLFGVEGEEVAAVDIVNITHPDNEVTLHIPRNQSKKGEYKIELTLFQLEERETGTDEEGEIKLVTQKENSKQITFTLP